VNNLRALASRAYSLIRPRVETPLRLVLREDRLLLWGTIGLWVAGLIPLFMTPFLPFPDMPNNAAAASLMFTAGSGHGPVAEAFKVSWSPTPYLIVHALLAVLGPLLGALLAAKVVVALLLLMVPLGVMRLLVTLRRDPRLALWAFLLGYDHNLFAGWTSFVAGIGLVMFVIAWTLEARTVREALRVSLAAALVGLAHIQAVWLMMIALPLLVFFGRPFKQRFLVHLTAGAGLAITILPWLASRLWTSGHPGAGQSWAYEFHNADYKISTFYAYTLDNFWRPPASRVAALAFVVVLLGPLCLSLLPRKATGDRTFAPLPLLATATGLYAFLFMSIEGPIIHWYTYPRYATVMLLFWLLLPAPRLRGRWALALLPGVLMVLALDYQITRAFRRFGWRTDQLVEVIKHVKPESSVLPLLFDDEENDPDLKQPAYHQLTSYIAACRRAVMPSLFDFPALPLAYRQEKRTPWPGWDLAAERAFTMEQYGNHYDYVVVQGWERTDPLAALQNGPLPRPRLVIEAGRWRLYEMQH